VPAFPVPIVSEQHEVTLLIRSFKIAAGDVVENQMAFLQQNFQPILSLKFS